MNNERVKYSGETTYLTIEEGIIEILEPVNAEDKNYVLYEKLIAHFKEGFSKEVPNSLNKNEYLELIINNKEIGWMRFHLYKDGHYFDLDDDVAQYFDLHNEYYKDNPLISAWDYWYFAASELINFKNTKFTIEIR